jgi:hypothetical protein
VPFPSIFDYSPELARVIFKTAQQDYETGRGIPNNEDPPNDPDDRQLPPVVHPALHIAKALGAGVLGLGAGAAAGRGGYELLRHATKDKMPPGPWHAIAPALGAAGGLAYSLAKERELQELRRAVAGTNNNPPNSGR